VAVPDARRAASKCLPQRQTRPAGDDRTVCRRLSVLAKKPGKIEKIAGIFRERISIPAAQCGTAEIL